MKLALGNSAVAGLAILAACSADPTGLHPTATSVSVQGAPLPFRAKPDMVARAFALGMNDPVARAGVRDAMRASLVTEHKLVLQDFARTPAGRTLLTAGAARLGVSVASLESIIAELPAMDFYVPKRAHRLGWRGDAAIRVGALTSRDKVKFAAYDVNGGTGDLMAAIADNAGATFVLQPAETKSRRIHPQKSVPGTAIQDPDDGELSGSIVDYLPDGSTKVTELADYYAKIRRPPAIAKGKSLTTATGSLQSFTAPVLPSDIEPCEPYLRGVSSSLVEDCGGGGGGGGGGGAPPDTTYLGRLVVIHVCDWNNCDEGNEFEWHTYFSNDNGSTWTNRRDFRWENIGANTDLYFFNARVLFKKIRFSNEQVTSDVVETDGWQGTDHFPPSPRWYLGDNFYIKTEGESRCGYWNNTGNPEWGPAFDCNAWPYVHWRQVNQSFEWNP